MEDHGLPPEIREIAGQRTCPFGDAALALNDAVLAAETCEELFTPAAPHIALALSGVEIITNGSGSHHQVRLGTSPMKNACREILSSCVNAMPGPSS